MIVVRGEKGNSLKNRSEVSALRCKGMVGLRTWVRL